MGLLAEIAPIVRNTDRISGTEATFTKVTNANPTQARGARRTRPEAPVVSNDPGSAPRNHAPEARSTAHTGVLRLGSDSRLRLDIEPKLLRTEGDTEVAEEALLAEEMKRERPRVAERCRGVVADARDNEVRPRVMRRDDDAADDDPLARRPVEIDSDCLGDPRTKPVRGRAGVDQAALRNPLETLDLHGNGGPRERRRVAWKLDELEPQNGPPPWASAVVRGTRNMPYEARRSCRASQASTS